MPRTTNTATSIKANATILTTYSDEDMYLDTHEATMSANLADAQMPAMIDTMEIA
jgi:hypothetical protein